MNYRITYFPVCTSLHGSGKTTQKKRRASKTLCILIRVCNLTRTTTTVSGEGFRFYLPTYLIFVNEVEIPRSNRGIYKT
ncbi:hypothetical protein 000TH008_194 [Bacillus phage 000TH008]|nr:hypothetical protein 000TH008_194 [Bacillus phage 000TH008]